jgi:hypothetical protein
LPLLLTGCVVGNMDSTDYQYVKYAQTFQKLDKTGRTDTAQRKEDLYSCGVPRRANLDDGSWNGGSARPGKRFRKWLPEKRKSQAV